ncbi:hypothetical protein BGZ99_003258 [Dissophora globulifera]|uniref:NRDE-2, necessary for RNA interference-domain-containing protein n=1 Tax=Dissophora globulifera TaxID=979702 RepID=A0A9P6UWL0_9FUNG|nr:hypothetical protein BGZ99_003258 [Dissophora globulifera]
MSNSPRPAPFSAQVLDSLDLSTSNAQNTLQKRADPGVQLAPSVKPPSFDSFPDIAPLAPSFDSFPDITPLAPSSGAPTWNSFASSSSPIDTPSSNLSSLAMADPSKSKKKKKREHKEEHEPKKENKDRDRTYANEEHRRHRDDNGDSRDRQKDRGERKRSRSRGRGYDGDRSSSRTWSHRDDVQRSDQRGRDDRSETKDPRRSSINIKSNVGSNRQNESRDQHRQSKDRPERSDERNSSRYQDRDRDRDHHRSSTTSNNRHGSGSHSRDHGNRSPDRKRSRIDEVRSRKDETKSRKDESLSSRGKQPVRPNIPTQRLSGSGSTDKNHKPGTWIIDVKGDKDAIRYDGLELSSIPLYFRAGDGRVIGLPGHERIDFAKTRALGGRTILMRVPGQEPRALRYSDPNATWRDKSQEYRRITRAKAEELARTLDTSRQDPSFIPLDIRSGVKKHGPSSDSDDSEDEIDRDDEDEDMVERKKKVDYRDIHGKSVHKDEDEDLLQTISDQEEEGAESALDVLKRRKMMLDGELRKDSKQPEKWLEFIAVEDEIDLVSNKRSAKAANAHSAGHLEIKMSIFERALASNPTSEHLLLEYMTACRNFWEPAKVLAKWDELLHSDKIQTAWPGLWIEYLDFRQRQFLSFSVKSFERALEDALNRLGGLARLTWLAMQRNADNIELQTQLVKVESVMIHIVARAWTFLKQAGYIERAQAIIQGQVEFLFNMPPSLEKESWEIQIGSLEEYWDSELPRFGEKDAKGWTHYVTEEDEVAMESQLEQTKLPSKEAPDMEFLRAFADNEVERYQYTRWAKFEKELDTLCWFPIRTTEDLPDEIEDDPYGVIIFDDIRPFIVTLYTREARLQFVDCMFNFLGIPLNSLVGSNGLRSLNLTPLLKAGKPNGPYNPYFHDGLLLNVGMDVRSTLDANVGLKRFFPEFEDPRKRIERVKEEIKREQELREPEERDWSRVWQIPLCLFPQGPDTIFGKMGDSESTTQYSWATVSRHEEVQISNKLFIRNTFQQLMEVVPLPKAYRRGLSLYHLMYEALDTLSTSKCQKLAKKYLKGDRMDLELWNGYAQAERALGRISEARKIYSTALSMYQTLPAENQSRVPMIYRYFSQLEWEQGRPGVALAILVAFAEGTIIDISTENQTDMPKPSPTRLIKSRQFYAQKVAQLSLVRPASSSDETVGGKWMEPAVDLIVCFAWFEYLSCSTEVSRLESGIKVFENAIQELDFRNADCEIEVPIDSVGGGRSDQDALRQRQRQQHHQPGQSSSLAALADLEAEKRTVKKKICTGVEAEMVWIQLARLVYLHSLQVTMASHLLSREHSELGSRSGGVGFQPRDLRRVVQAGLERFPNSTILQSLFFWSEAKQRLHGRVRKWVSEQLARKQGTQRVSGGGPLGSQGPLWMFGLFYELWQQEPYNVHVVRSLLESVLESSTRSSFGSSPTLWIMYIELEMRESVRSQLDSSNGGKKDKDKHKNKKPSRVDLGVESGGRVKQLLMRALNDCPWSKDLYLLAFEPRMKALFSIDELEQLFRTMLEKEIRVRHEIPEREQSDVAMSLALPDDTI